MDSYLEELLAARFDPVLAGTPYTDNEAHLRDVMGLVALCLGFAAVYQAPGEDGEPGDTLSGGAMQPEEAAEYLWDFPDSGEEPVPELTAMVDAAQRYIKMRVAASTKAGQTLRLERLRSLLQLEDFPFFCLSCVLASTLDRAFERSFVAIHGDTGKLCPTLGAVASVYRLVRPLPAATVARLSDPGCIENRLLFLPPAEETHLLLRPLALRGVVLSYLLAQGRLDTDLLGRCEIIEDGMEAPEALYLEEQLATTRAACELMNQRTGPLLLLLCGRAGSGRRLTLRHTAGGAGRFLVFEADALPWREKGEALAAELLGLAFLHGLTPCLVSQDPGSLMDDLGALLDAFCACGLGLVLLCEPLRNNIVLAGWPVVRVDYPDPSLAQAHGLWQHFAAQAGTDLDALDIPRLAAKYVLSPGQIKNALAGAELMARLGRGAVNERAVDQAVLLGNTGRLSEIADKIETVYTWDDLVLDETPKQRLRDVCNRVRLRSVVEGRWGYLKKSAYGNGLSVLLYGPPGTGKTMSAQVIAGELGLPLYRINLAQIVSKYIGETAKNLDVVFSEAKSSNVVLFFDEADALFASRTDVKDSNDRHANSESAYLLQKIEEYTGISILATNLMHNFDEAFRRRINYMVNIHMPSVAQRLQLWRGMLPPKAPLADDVNLAALAEGLAFSGSVIKSASLQAAYFAAEEGGAITMGHYIRAVRLELQKLGKSEPHFLSGWPA